MSLLHLLSIIFDESSHYVQVCPVEVEDQQPTNACDDSKVEIPEKTANSDKFKDFANECTNDKSSDEIYGIGGAGMTILNDAGFGLVVCVFFALIKKIELKVSYYGITIGLQCS